MRSATAVPVAVYSRRLAYGRCQGPVALLTPSSWLLLLPPLPPRPLIGPRGAWEEIVGRCEEVGVDAFEINFSCPHGEYGCAGVWLGRPFTGWTAWGNASETRLWLGAYLPTGRLRARCGTEQVAGGSCLVWRELFCLPGCLNSALQQSTRHPPASRPVSHVHWPHLAISHVSPAPCRLPSVPS